MNFQMKAATGTRKIGLNRGKRRLWLEGKVLMEAGFAHGENWTLTQGRGSITIEADPDGKRRVSGKADRPVIDILGASLGDLQKAATVSISYYPGAGIIEVTGIEWREAS